MGVSQNESNPLLVKVIHALNSDGNIPEELLQLSTVAAMSIEQAEEFGYDEKSIKKIREKLSSLLDEDKGEISTNCRVLIGQALQVIKLPAYISVVTDDLMEWDGKELSEEENKIVHDVLVSIADEAVKKFKDLDNIKKVLFELIDSLGDKMSDMCRAAIDEATRNISIWQLEDPIYDVELYEKLPQDGVSVYLDAVGDFENMGLDSDTIKKLIETGWTEYLPEAKGILQITDEHCEGHFKRNPTFPGIKMLEFANQTAIMFGYEVPEMKEYGKFDVLFVGMEGKTKYRKPAKPGDILTAEVNIIEKSFKEDRGSVVFKAKITNQTGVVICTIDNFKGMVVKRKNQ